MRRMLILAVTLTAFAPAAFAQPVSLSNDQMDALTAGITVQWTQATIAFTATNTPGKGLSVLVHDGAVVLKDVN